MPPRNWKMRIRDILDSISAVQEYTSGMDFEAFSKDRKTVDAVVRNITIIGEASRNVPADKVGAYPEVPWKLMRDFRNVVAHVYFGIPERVLWDTVQDDLPPLVPLLQKLLQKD